MTPTVRLAGIEIGGDNVYEWPLTTGVMPHEHIFTVTERVAEKLRGVLQGVSSTSPGIAYEVIRPDGKPNLRVNRLFVADIFPGASTFTRRIRVVDSRWLWQFKHVASTFNERRVTAGTLLVAEGANPEVPQIDPEIVYAKYSLYNEVEPYTVSQALAEVLTAVHGHNFNIPPDVAARFDKTPVDDLALDDAGHFAIERCLAYLAGATVYVDRDGRAVVTDTLDGSEVPVYEANKDRQQTQISVRISDRRYIRPSKVVVLFTPELEVRFDYTEPTTGGTRTADNDTNQLDNVAVMPDPLGLDVDGKTVGPGTYVPLDDLFDAYGNGPGYGGDGVLRPLSWDILRKHRANGFRYTQLEFSLIDRDTGLIDIPWSRRIGKIVQGYRSEFKLRDVFVQRLASIRPVRAAVVSPITGTRAESPVYSDYIRRPSMHGMAKSVSGALQGTQVQGYATKLAEAKAAPARVRVLNPGAGVIRVDVNDSDPGGLFGESMLGYSSQGIPYQSLTPNQFKSLDEQFHFMWDHVELDAGWQMSIILSCSPASPNTLGKLLAVEISPNEAGEVLGRDPGPCWGPVAYVRVFPGVVTARYAWDDDSSEEIIQAIKGEGSTDSNGGGEFPKSLLVNADHVRDVARAAAARLYAGVLDRPFGTLEVDMQPDLEPTGAISEVRHVMQGGATRTLVKFGTVAAPRDIWRFLPASTRRTLMRSLQATTDPLAASMGTG